jgi:EAL domain-containing protein (putative c-di-GMP-specific phosphodiesterase class I)
MVEMGRRLGIDVIATRLEQTSHLELAVAAGCRRGQGFALAEPGHAERIEAYLEHHRAPLF